MIEYLQRSDVSEISFYMFFWCIVPFMIYIFIRLARKKPICFIQSIVILVLGWLGLLIDILVDKFGKKDIYSDNPEDK